MAFSIPIKLKPIQGSIVRGEEDNNVVGATGNWTPSVKDFACTAMGVARKGVVVLTNSSFFSIYHYSYYLSFL